MKCPKCNKEIEQTLVLYDGTLVCPLCKKIIVDDDIKFQVTEENNELFVQSEVSFLKGIKSTNQQEQYDKAVELCGKAAALGHPKAIQKMAYYYDKGFVDSDRTETYRTMIAYQYYSSLAFSKQKGIETEGHLPKYDLPRLKYNAACDMLHMLTYFDNDRNIEKYSVKYNYLRLKNKYPDIRLPAKSKESLNRKPKRLSDIILDTLIEGTKGGHRPLYGVFKINGAKFKELLEAERDEENVFITLMRSKNYIFLYCPDYTEDTKCMTISSQNQYDRCLEDVSESETNPNFLFIFFNERPNFKKIEKNKLPLIEKAFLNDDVCLTLIKEGGQSEYIFFEDDIYWNKKKENNYKNAIDELVKNVVALNEEE